MQSTKQRWDWRIQETLVKEVLRLDPENEYIKKWCNMENHHGANIRKARDYYLKHGKSPEEKSPVYNEKIFDDCKCHCTTFYCKCRWLLCKTWLWFTRRIKWW